MAIPSVFRPDKRFTQRLQKHCVFLHAQFKGGSTTDGVPPGPKVRRVVRSRGRIDPQPVEDADLEWDKFSTTILQVRPIQNPGPVAALAGPDITRLLSVSWTGCAEHQGQQRGLGGRRLFTELSLGSSPLKQVSRERIRLSVADGLGA